MRFSRTYRNLRLFCFLVAFSSLVRSGPDSLCQSGLGAVIANAFAAEGCNIAINYASREGPAVELQGKLIKEFEVQSCVIKGVS